MRGFGRAVGIVLGMVSCGGDNSGPAHVEISGKSPAEAAAVAGRAFCTHEAACGSVSIVCLGGGSAGATGSDASAPTFVCTATIEPVVYDVCYADISADIERLLMCAAPTPDQTNMLEVCFDTLVARSCATQAEVDAQVRAIEAGVEPTRDPPPAACALITSRPPGC